MDALILITIAIPLVIFSWMFPYLLLKYPLHKFDINKYRSSPALSDYGMVSVTSRIYNISFLLVGILLTLNSVLLGLYHGLEPSTWIPMAISTLCIALIGVFPSTKESKRVLENTVHWTVAISGLLIYPISLFVGISAVLDLGLPSLVVFVSAIALIIIVGFSLNKKVITELLFIILSTTLCYALNYLMVIYS